jgi:hypothetical protein
MVRNLFEQKISWEIDPNKTYRKLSVILEIFRKSCRVDAFLNQERRE